jgi:hypothetical protein
MHITVVSHGKPKDKVSFERTTRAELLKDNNKLCIGFLHAPNENEVIEMVKRKKSWLIIFNESPGSFVQKTCKTVTRKFNGKSPIFKIHAGEIVPGVEKIKDLSEVRTLQIA